MAEPEERKPFITFSFTEEGVFDRYAGIYLHLPLEKPPTGEEIAIMVGTIKTYAKCFAELQGKGVVARLRESEEPPPDGHREASAPKPAHPPRPSPGPAVRDPSAPASKKQLGMIRGMCEKVDDQIVIATFEKFQNFEGVYSDEGRYIPSWEFLNELTKGEAHFAIDALKKFEGSKKQETRMPFD